MNIPRYIFLQSSIEKEVVLSDHTDKSMQFYVIVLIQLVVNSFILQLPTSIAPYPASHYLRNCGKFLVRA